jgi:hypothetical protein
MIPLSTSLVLHGWLVVVGWWLVGGLVAALEDLGSSNHWERSLQPTNQSQRAIYITATVSMDVRGVAPESQCVAKLYTNYLRTAALALTNP